jgi:hypothetical protein
MCFEIDEKISRVYLVDDLNGRPISWTIWKYESATKFLDIVEEDSPSSVCQSTTPLGVLGIVVTTSDERASL